MAKLGKNRSGSAIGFDSLFTQDFDNIGSIGASVANTTVQASLPFPQRFKLQKVGLSYTAIGTGSYAFNIVVGTGAEVACNTTKDAIAAAGNITFASDQAITIAAPGVPQVFVPAQPDTIYDSNSATPTQSFVLMTLRVVTPAGGSITNLKVMLICALADPLANHSGAVPGVDW